MAFLALKEFQHILSNSSGMIATDNSSIVAYIQKEGGTNSPTLCMEVWETLVWCHEREISLRVRHIPGKINILADRLSRMSKPISTEWSLDQSICNSILLTEHFSIGLFATRLNNRLPLYVSLIPDSKAVAIDAMSIRDSRICVFFFSHHSSNSNQDTHASMQDSANCSLLASENLVPRVTQSVSSSSHFSPCNSRCVNATNRKDHKFSSESSDVSLLVWILSNDPLQIETFRKTLPITFLKQEDLLHERCMRQNGAYLPVDVVKGRLLLTRSLLQT